MKTRFTLAVLPLALASAFAQADDTAAAQDGGELQTVYVTAERQLQQSLGVSKSPPKIWNTAPPSTTFPTSCAPCRGSI